MNKPTKKQLYEQIEKLENEKNEEKIKNWKKLIPNAYAAFQKQVGSVFPKMLKFVELEHIDDAGYWFSFELKNDDRRQNYVIRHREAAQTSVPDDVFVQFAKNLVATAASMCEVTIK